MSLTSGDNPVLAAYREYVKAFGDDGMSEAQLRAQECADGALRTYFTQQDIQHAQRVLTKRTAVYGTTNEPTES